MKFTIGQAALNSVLSTVSKAVSGKSTLQLVQGIYFRAEDGVLTTRGTDFVIGIETSVGCNVEEPGAVVLPTQAITDLVRRIPYGDLSFIVDPRNHEAKVFWGKSQYRIPGLEAEEFPTLPNVEEASVYRIQQSALKRLVRRAVIAVEVDTARPWMDGALLHFAGNQANATSTDNTRIVLATEPIDNPGNEESRVIFPSRTLIELTRMLTEEGEAELYVSPNQVLMKLGEVLVSSRNIDDKFPDVNRLLPQNFQSQITMNRQELVESVTRVRDTVGDVVRLDITDGVARITARDKKSGKEAYEEIGAGTLNGESIDFRVSGRKLLDYLKVIEDAEVRVETTGPNRPLRLSPVTETGIVYWMAPMIPMDE